MHICMFGFLVVGTAFVVSIYIPCFVFALSAMAAFSDRHLEPEKAETRFVVTSSAFQKVPLHCL